MSLTRSSNNCVSLHRFKDWKGTYFERKPRFIFYSTIPLELILFLVLLNRKQSMLWIQGDIFRTKQKTKEVAEDSLSKVLSGFDDISISGTSTRIENLDKYIEVRLHWNNLQSHLKNMSLISEIKYLKFITTVQYIQNVCHI